MKNSYIVLRVALAMFLLVSTLDIAFPPLSAPGVTPGRRTLIDRVIHGSPIAMFGMGEDTSGDAIRVDAASVFALPNTGESSTFVGLTCGSTTKGAWVEAIASTDRQTIALSISAGSASASIDDFIIDIGTGAGGSEVPVIPDLGWTKISNVGQGSVTWTIPFDIPPSTRIAGRCNYFTGGATPAVRLNVVSWQRI